MTTPPHPRPPLDASRIASEVGPITGLTLELVDETDSTNALAATRARAGAADGLLVVAEHQRAGRGRLDRSWETPPGAGLTFSLVLRPDLPAAQWPWLPLLTGHAVAQALVALGYEARVKWPNDVLIPSTGSGHRDYHKVAGILVERVDTPDGPAAILGVGLNVAMTAAELPVPTATSLHLARPDIAPDRDTVLVRIAAALREEYDAWRTGGDEAAARLASSYAEACATVGQQVRVDLPGGGTLAGRAIDVDRSGMLVVETDTGVERVGAGDVVHVRPDAG